MIHIVICIIYVHDDDINVSVYEYVNIYADENGCACKYLCMHELENEKWLSRL